MVARKLLSNIWLFMAYTILAGPTYKIRVYISRVLDRVKFGYSCPILR